MFSLHLAFRDLPNMGTGANARSRLVWAERAKVIREDRTRWGWLIVAQKAFWLSWIVAHPPPYRVTWEVRYHDRRTRDADGILSALKTALDAAVQVGLLPGDSLAVIPETAIRVKMGVGVLGQGTTLILEALDTRGRDGIPIHDA